jgi:diguanylate cyclase (GGDEF)-like protein
MATRAQDDAMGFSLKAPATGARSTVPLILFWLLLCGVYSSLHFVADRTRPLEILRQVVYLAPILIAFIASAMAIFKTDSREQRLWRGIAAAVGLILVSETLVSLRVIELGPVSKIWSDSAAIFSIVAALLFITTLLALADFRMLSQGASIRNVADTAGLSLLLFGGILAGVLGPLTASYEAGDPSGNVVLAIFSTIGFLTMTATWMIFATRKGIHWRGCERQLVLGVGVYGFATAMFPLWALGAEISRLSHWELPVELLWITGMYLLFVGALARLRLAPGESCFFALPRLRASERGLHAMATSVIFTLGIPFFGYLALSGGTDSITSGGYAVTALGLTAVMVAHSAIAAMENDYLFGKAVNDQLTDIYGHRYFFERLGLELDIAKRRGARVQVVLLDLDGFSRVNAARGHGFGDEILRGVAAILVGTVRNSDVACRLGADKFAVIMPSAAAQDAVLFAEKIRSALAQVATGDGSVLTASLGYAGYPGDSLERDELVQKAEGALYWAKYHGRDRAVAFDESVVDSLSAHDRIKHLEKESHLSTVRALAAAVDARDPLTQFHSRNVAVLAVMLAEEIELVESQRRLLEVAALLHDVGKIGISDRVLRKRGPLLASEMRHIREHPGLGEKILASTQLVEILPWVRHHHERWDGTGYPDGLAGEDIPFEARLLCICDAYDAMTSGRPYRDSLSPTAALQELDLCIGSQFDPGLAEAFIRMVGRRRLLRPGLQSAREDSMA